MSLPSLSFGLEDTHILLTGAAGAIGTATLAHLLASGAKVTALDLHPDRSPLHNQSRANLFWVKADITSELETAEAFESARQHWNGRFVQCCIALASIDLSYLTPHESLVDMSLEQWRETFRVNVEGTFLTGREWLRGVKKWGKEEDRNVGLIVIGSEAAEMGVRGNADYSAGKAAVQVGFVQSLAGDASRIYRRARVNAVAPGAVDTPQFKKECQENPNELWLSTQATTAMGVPVSMDSVAKTILFLASESFSGHIHGQVVSVNAGKNGKVQWMPGEL